MQTDDLSDVDRYDDTQFSIELHFRMGAWGFTVRFFPKAANVVTWNSPFDLVKLAQ